MNTIYGNFQFFTMYSVLYIRYMYVDNRYHIIFVTILMYSMIIIKFPTEGIL